MKKFKPTPSTKDKRKKTWKYWGKLRKYPLFEVGVKSGDVFSGYKPAVEIAKMAKSGVGTVWDLDLATLDILTGLLVEARKVLVSTSDAREAALERAVQKGIKVPYFFKEAQCTK